MAKVDEERVQRIEKLVHRLEDIPDPADRQTARALMEAILELHGAGLERMMDIVFEAHDSGKATIRRFAGDDLVASLLVLHGLHPDDLETRVQHALTKIHGHAKLLSVLEGNVRVRLTGHAAGIRELVETTIREAAPDATEIIVEESVAYDGFVPLADLGIAATRNT